MSAASACDLHRADAGAAAPRDAAGFLVVASDRGFQGNEEIRDAFEAFADGRNAALVFVTDERIRDSLQKALGTLAQNGARRTVVVPLFISAANPRFTLVRKLLGSGGPEMAREGESTSSQPIASPIPVSFGRPFGESYLAVEALADRFRAIKDPKGRRVIVAGYGAKDDETRKRMEADWQRIADKAAEGFGFATVRTVVWYDRTAPDQVARRAEAERALAEAAAGGERVVVAPFHFGRKLDGMMSFDADLKWLIPSGSELLAEDAGPHPALAMWMAREASRHLPLKPEDIGVVFLAHGADYHWNETMRQAVRPLEDRYKIEFVFSMADQPLIERAVRRLERRSARAIVIVRVFGLASAFRDEVERMIGLDVENGPARRMAHTSRGTDHGHEDGHGHGDDHGHGSGGTAAPPARIRSPLPMSTGGGVEADPLFAAALLDHARELSRDPRRETVILVAHGSGDDAKNNYWLKTLQTLAEHMRANGGSKFRAICFATWREDWPDKRAPWVAKVQDMVREAARDGGRAIVIPARTQGRGPEQEFLAGLSFELGSGFAPHPLFARWFEEQVRAGIAGLGVGVTGGAVTALASGAASQGCLSDSWLPR